MTEQLVRHRHPVTNVIEYVTRQYGAVVGLVPFDGETDRTEIDKTDCEIAVLSEPIDLDTALKADLVEYAEARDIDSSGKVEDLRARVKSHVTLFGDSEKPHGDPAAGESENTNPQEEG